MFLGLFFTTKTYFNGISVVFGSTVSLSSCASKISTVEISHTLELAKLTWRVLFFHMYFFPLQNSTSSSVPNEVLNREKGIKGADFECFISFIDIQKVLDDVLSWIYEIFIFVSCVQGVPKNVRWILIALMHEETNKYRYYNGWPSLRIEGAMASFSVAFKFFLGEGIRYENNSWFKKSKVLIK